MCHDYYYSLRNVIYWTVAEVFHERKIVYNWTNWPYTVVGVKLRIRLVEFDVSKSVL